MTTEADPEGAGSCLYTALHTTGRVVGEAPGRTKRRGDTSLRLPHGGSRGGRTGLEL